MLRRNWFKEKIFTSETLQYSARKIKKHRLDYSLILGDLNAINPDHGLKFEPQWHKKIEKSILDMPLNFAIVLILIYSGTSTKDIASESRVSCQRVYDVRNRARRMMYYRLRHYDEIDPNAKREYTTALQWFKLYT